MIDTHVHYNLDPFWPDWQKHWQMAQAAGVTHSIVIGTDEQTNQRAEEIAQTEKNLFYAVGVHPHEAGSMPAESVYQYFTKILDKSAKKPVALGECGLDYFRLDASDTKTKTAQKQLFGVHIRLAKEKNLPLIIHARDAYEDILDVTEHFCKNDGVLPRAVLHCASGPVSYIQKAISWGWYVSFAGNVTYKNADSLRELLKFVPMDRLLLETDAPYLPPQSKRGQFPNEPTNIVETYAFVAKEKKVSPDVLREKIMENASSLFIL